MRSEKDLKDSSVLKRVRGRNMPPNADALSKEDRERLLSFF
jgi:hypothetical protein